MFKKIVHYFASKSLEMHRIKTQYMIEEYELASAETQTRIQGQADEYAGKLRALSLRHENELEEYMQFLNQHLTSTTEHVTQLKHLLQMMFGCLEDWMSKSLCEQRLPGC